MKALRKIFNLLSIVFLLWTIISGAYLALPQEYKDLIPEFNWLTAVVSGGSTGILGTTILLIQNYFKKKDMDYSNKYLDLAQKFLELREDNKATLEENKLMREENKVIREEIAKTNKLITLDLQSKLSNPLVEEYIKEKIRGEGVDEQKE